MGQMANLLATICKRIPSCNDERPPGWKHRPSTSRSLLDSTHEVEDESDENETSDTAEPPNKRRRGEDELRKLYQFTCLPNGLSSAPRTFTKIFKVPITYLHKQGHISLGHLDDFLHRAGIMSSVFKM